MAAQTKPMQMRIRIADEDVQVLQALAGKTLSLPAVASSLLAAAIQAVRENQGRLSFPPTLSVIENDPQRMMSSARAEPSPPNRLKK